MKKMIVSERIPIKLWCDDIDEHAMRQVRNIANFPFAFHHVAVMPDAHVGYGMPIGGVLATEGMIIPNAVGVDIGCGMCAVQTSLIDITAEQLMAIMSAIRNRIPLGFKHQMRAHPDEMPDVEVIKGGVVEREYRSATFQIGSLGGGNHFIEIQKGSDGHIWVMLHSGSRNIGKKVADHYNQLAKKKNRNEHSPVSPEVDLAYLPLQSEEGQQYFAEMNYCLEFAKANRNVMIDMIKDIFREKAPCDFDATINIHHNYAERECHFGHEVIVHRKGATAAMRGQLGIIPGSQGTNSYIIKGKGNSDSFMSCSHGAGRRMGRHHAIKTLDLDEEIRSLDEKGVLHSIRGRNDLDEAPSAYKDIRSVIDAQSDLIEVLVELVPLGGVKG